MSKVVSVLLIAVMLVSGIALAEQEKLIIGSSQLFSNESQNGMMEGFEAYINDWNAAGNTPVLEYRATNCESSLEKQIGDIESLIELGADAIFVDPVDTVGIIPAFEECAENGVKVVELRGVDSDAVSCSYMGNDEYSMAELAYKWYAEKLDANPELNLRIGLVYGLASQTQQLIRIDHLVALLQENYGDRIEILAEQFCDWDVQKALECTENWLQRFPDGDMNCIISAASNMACGIAGAVAAAGYDMDDWIITATDSTADILQAINDGTVDMTIGIDVTANGRLAAEMTIKVALGEYTDRNFNGGDRIIMCIDESNISEWYEG